MKREWFVYLLRCKGGVYYVGITTDLARRVEQHNNGTGAKYTRGRSPCLLVRSVRCENRSEASKLEAAWKKLTKQQKQEMEDPILKMMRET